MMLGFNYHSDLLPLQLDLASSTSRFSSLVFLVIVHL